MNEKIMEEIILQEIANENSKPDYITLAYAFYILHNNEEIVVSKINKAIVARWGLTTLDYIKKKAWKIMEGDIK